MSNRCPENWRRKGAFYRLEGTRFLDDVGNVVDEVFPSRPQPVREIESYDFSDHEITPTLASALFELEKAS